MSQATSYTSVRMAAEPSETPGDFLHHEDSGTLAAPPCSEFNRNHCPFTEDYPIDIVTQVTKFLKWPLEKLFRDLRQAQSPPLMENGDGALVCDSLTRIVRPGWAKNTNSRWLVVINTHNYEQFVTETTCRHENSQCNFVAPCFYASCQQRFNIQKLLVIDPSNPYKGPFLSQFLFPSCCVCYVPGTRAINLQQPKSPYHEDL
ncbi:uncharacterized protein LOC8039702 [Ixodes scapularis]|uniref:uncharacterized protein LOC8039702 n=1 Tax=Ixodes scapularis TaxID=6945 RepID=UPI001A9E60C3|nr:uncharacterized protein LOC8039702 [Ixodes scapularis]